MTDRTGWLRYRIGTSAGLGEWQYLNWDFEDDKEAAQEIIYNEERWICSAERASVYVEVNVVPPIYVVERQLQRTEEWVKFYQDNSAKLKEFLAAHGENNEH